jgi:hypothetical protein
MRLEQADDLFIGSLVEDGVERAHCPKNLGRVQANDLIRFP